MTGTEDKALYIAQRCIEAGMTVAGAAGILANIAAESAFKSTNVEDSKENRLNMNDAQYTTAVDSGRYAGFTGDEAGYGLCQTLWNAPDVLDAYVMIADEQLDAVEGYKERIHHEPTPQPEPEPEPTEE